MATFSPISVLKPYKSSWKIHVKVLKHWKSFLNNVETVEAVVVDDKNHKIHITIKKNLINKYKSFLVEDGSICITNLKVSPIGGHFRTTAHPYKIFFVDTTWIKPSNDFPTGINGLTFVPFAEIHGGGKNTDFLIDVIGQVININSVQILNANNKQTKKLTMELRDIEDDRIQCVLWGEYADRFEEYVQEKNDVVIIFVLQFGKLNFYNDTWSVGNSYNCSRIFLDPTFPEVEEFITRLPTDGLTFSKSHPQQLTVVNTNSVKDDFLIHSPRKTIAEILASSEVVNCVTMGTIMSIDTEYGWYYLAFKVCSKKVLPAAMEEINKGREQPITTKLWKCTGKCKEYMTDRVPRYMVTLRVMDNTGETKFLLFDKLAEKIINASALQLNPSLDEIENPEILPLPLTNVCGRTILFKISIEKEHILGQKETYKVFSIITESETVKEFSDVEISQFPLNISNSVNDESTPASKRKSESSSEENIGSDGQSVTKKVCVSKMNTLEDELSILSTIKIEKP